MARETGLAAADIETFYRWWPTTQRVVSCYSQGVNQSAQGTDKVNAIINCHLATARIGKPGSGPLSLTGQPNAMGGREVGGLANMLAAHMGFSEAERDRVRRFWGAPNLVTGEGLKAVQMFDAIADGRIKALWVMGTNPAVQPAARRCMCARRCGGWSCWSSLRTSPPTTRVGLAHVRLPAAAWGEKDGTVTNSERRISRQRAFLPLPGEARPDWWILSRGGAAAGLGAARSPIASAADIFASMRACPDSRTAASAPSTSRGSRPATRPTTRSSPVQWPLPADESARHERLFADGGFFTAGPQGPLRRRRAAAPRARPAALAVPAQYRAHPRPVAHHDAHRPVAALATHIAEPFVEMHPTTPRASASSRARWRA